ncbi:thiamine ABC transporter substrate-binding protein [Thermococcus sp.]
MKKLGLILGMLIVFSLIAAAQPVKAGENELVVYAYDSFVSYGLANATIPKFEKMYGVKVKVITAGDAGEVLNRLILEKDSPQADVVIGIDNNLLSKAIEAGVLEPYKPKNIDVVPKELIFDPTYHVVPFDYGFIALVYKKDRTKNPPQSFDDLTKPEWKKSIIIEDPRTSSTGMAFLLWTIAVYGDKWLYFWEKLKPNIYQITKGWDAGWEMWDKGEAPLFVSYATDPAYDAYYYTNGSEPNIGAVIFKEGAYPQIEGIGIVKNCRHPELAKKFIEFVLSEDFQKEIPLHNWMFPVNKNIQLPEVYKYAAKPDKLVTLDPKQIEQNYKKWLDQWTQLMVEGKSPDEILGKTSTSKSKSSICGPAVLILLALTPLLLRRR